MSTPASTTEPAVGACVCASGSQVCTGKAGSFTANAAKKPSMIQVAVADDMGVCNSAVTSKVNTPVARWCTKASARMAMSMSRPPICVKMKNFTAAYRRRS